jgi:uncharacterized membrane protein
MYHKTAENKINLFLIIYVIYIRFIKSFIWRQIIIIIVITIIINSKNWLLHLQRMPQSPIPLKSYN